MGFLSNLFNKKDETINTNADFWNWFQQNEKAFYKITQSGANIEGFHTPLGQKLNELRDGYYFLSGMLNGDTAELIITADGNIKNLVFIEQLIVDAPAIPGWKFTAHKPALDIENVSISMNGYTFSDKTLSFFTKEDKNHPDEIDIVIVNNDFTEDNKDQIIVGTHIFLDNFLGEINFATTIDNISVIGKNDTDKELIPIEKLKSYLIWREKEFVEKYEGIRHNTDDDTYASFEAAYANGNAMVGVINTSLLEWDSIASHPWIAHIEIEYNGKARNGMPDEKDFNLMGELENKLLDELKDSDGYLNVGRETGNNTRTIYFACKEFRKPSKVVDAVMNNYSSKLNITYSIYKDKYWQTFDKFKN
jgi:hypothetical protein